ncbi:hypothetical protein PHLCEN_2v2109 [Hermanssonia centrifuga]|uniref:Uncharacterized protein n=1 Tax=Hermanssonia centrifuga TaxID=98765 RepID=A0A2R6RQ08_9APHY|nr:hypothetical protein PHLCEN_2v2109 [Hermanssonia centrifuga]
MADPVGIIAFGLQADDVYQNIKGAPVEIKALREDAIALEGISPKIKEILAKEPDSGRIAVLVSRAQQSTASVEKFIEVVPKVVEGKQKVMKVMKVRWISRFQG